MFALVKESIMSINEKVPQPPLLMSLNNPSYQHVNHPYLSLFSYALCPSLLVVQYHPTRPFFKSCIVNYVNSIRKWVSQKCGHFMGVIYWKYNCYEAHVKTRHNLPTFQGSTSLASNYFLQSKYNETLIFICKKRDVGGMNK